MRLIWISGDLFLVKEERFPDLVIFLTKSPGRGDPPGD